jgi:hypothetical protein
MPTKRTWRERQSVEFPSAYQAAELLTGEICYPVIQYTGPPTSDIGPRRRQAAQCHNRL